MMRLALIAADAASIRTVQTNLWNSALLLETGM